MYFYDIVCSCIDTVSIQVRNQIWGRKGNFKKKNFLEGILINFDGILKFQFILRNRKYVNKFIIFKIFFILFFFKNGIKSILNIMNLFS